MSLVGSHGTVSMTGSDFATDFASYGVQSYWFEVSNEPSGGIGGYWMAAADGGIFSFGNAAVPRLDGWKALERADRRNGGDVEPSGLLARRI